MAQDSNTGIKIDRIADFLCDIIGIADAFCYDDHVVGETVKSCLAQLFNDILFKIDFFLGNQHCGCTDSQANIHCKEACVASHNLNNGTALMGLHGIAQLVDTFNSGVGSCVKTDTVICTTDIVVDRTGNADHIDTILGKRTGTAESAVTTDCDNAVKTKELTGGNRTLLSFFGHEFLTACSVEDGAASVNRSGYTAGIHFDNVTVDQTIPATANAIDFDAMIKTGTDNSADSSIHARCVAATGQNTNAFNTHKDSSC